VDGERGCHNKRNLVKKDPKKLRFWLLKKKGKMFISREEMEVACTKNILEIIP
jgi:hypothetical protein